MECPRCGIKTSNWPCPECGFPVLRIILMYQQNMQKQETTEFKHIP